MRTLTTTGVACLAVVGLTAGCGGGEGDGASGIELRMTLWSSNPDHLAVFEELAGEFMANHREVTDITFESVAGAEQIDTVFTTQAAEGDPPDLSWLTVESSLEYIDAGALVDLAPTLQATDGWAFDDQVPDLQERWRVGDAQYGVPFSTGPEVLYFNKDLYAEAGVKSPEELIARGNWTWEAFRQTSKDVHDALGVPGLVLNLFDFDSWARLMPILSAYGASPWNETETECTATSPEFGEGISLFHDMVFEDGSVPLPGQQANFWGGQAAATTAYLSANALLADATFDWGMVPVPGGPAGEVQPLGQAAMVVFSAGDNVDAATEFLAYMTMPENAARIAQFFPPARESLLEPSILAGNNEILTEDLVAPIIAASKENGQVLPVATNNSAVTDKLVGSLNEHVWVPDADIENALDQVCEAVQPAL